MALQSFQLFDVVGGVRHPPLGGALCSLRFQQDAHFVMVGDVFLVDGLDDGAPVHPQLDEALGLQSLECFPHRRAADAQPLGSLGQAQFIAALVLAGKERFSQDGGDLYPNRHGFF